MRKIILIDNDLLIRISWKLHFKGMNFEFIDFDRFEIELLKHLPKDTIFFVDSDLGPGSVTGQEVTHELKRHGYENLYLVTGFEAKSFTENDLQDVKKVFSKHPPDEKDFI